MFFLESQNTIIQVHDQDQGTEGVKTEAKGMLMHEEIEMKVLQARQQNNKICI